MPEIFLPIMQKKEVTARGGEPQPILAIFAAVCL